MEKFSNCEAHHTLASENDLQDVFVLLESDPSM